jgi:hypothetical protein
MGKRFYGAVVKTRHLDAMRRFLTETVGLGEPAVNSNFWLEYDNVSDGMVLAVEKDETASLPGEEGAQRNVGWCLSVDDLGEFEQRMTDRGFGPEAETETPSGKKMLIFRDPDGNRFMALGREAL